MATIITNYPMTVTKRAKVLGSKSSWDSGQKQQVKDQQQGSYTGLIHIQKLKLDQKKSQLHQGNTANKPGKQQEELRAEIILEILGPVAEGVVEGPGEAGEGNSS